MLDENTLLQSTYIVRLERSTEAAQEGNPGLATAAHRVGADAELMPPVVGAWLRRPGWVINLQSLRFRMPLCGRRSRHVE